MNNKAATRTATLAQLIAQTELAVSAGTKTQAGMLENPKLDLVNVDPLRLLRVSLTRIVDEAARAIEETVVDNTSSKTAYEVEYLVPNTEACFELLCVLAKGSDVPDVSRRLHAQDFGRIDVGGLLNLLAEVWTPFQSWLNSEGLVLDIHTLNRPYGVKRYAVFQVQALQAA